MGSSWSVVWLFPPVWWLVASLVRKSWSCCWDGSSAVLDPVTMALPNNHWSVTAGLLIWSWKRVEKERKLMRMVGLVFSTVVLVSVFSASAPQLVQGQAMANPAKVADAKMALRTLYIDHIFWVRSLVISTRLGEKQAVSEADEYGLANAKAIGGSVGPFYGQAAADKFTSLFVGHYSAGQG